MTRRSFIAVAAVLVALAAPAFSDDNDPTGPLVAPSRKNSRMKPDDRAKMIIDKFGFEKTATTPGESKNPKGPHPLVIKEIEDARKSPASKPFFVFFHDPSSDFSRGFANAINSKAVQKHAKDGFKVLIVEVTADSYFDRTYGGAGSHVAFFTTKGALVESLDRPNVDGKGLIEILDATIAASKRSEKTKK